MVLRLLGHQRGRCNVIVVHVSVLAGSVVDVAWLLLLLLLLLLEGNSICASRDHESPDHLELAEVEGRDDGDSVDGRHAGAQQLGLLRGQRLGRAGQRRLGRRRRHLQAQGLRVVALGVGLGGAGVQGGGDLALVGKRKSDVLHPLDTGAEVLDQSPSGVGVHSVHPAQVAGHLHGALAESSPVLPDHGAVGRSRQGELLALDAAQVFDRHLQDVRLFQLGVL